MPEEKKTGARKPTERGELFDRRVQETADRIHALSESAKTLPDEYKALLAETLEQLAISLEELQVTGEELTQQGEELEASRHIAEADRERYLELFTSAPSAYLVTDDQGIIEEANAAAVSLLKCAAALASSMMPWSSVTS